MIEFSLLFLAIVNLILAIVNLILMVTMHIDGQHKTSLVNAFAAGVCFAGFIVSVFTN